MLAQYPDVFMWAPLEVLIIEVKKPEIKDYDYTVLDIPLIIDYDEF